MEGLESVSVEQPGSGPAMFRLDFKDPPGHVIETLEYAMLNKLPLDIGLGGFPRSLLLVVRMDVRHEILDITTFGGPSQYLPLGRRFVQVEAIEYAIGT